MLLNKITTDPDKKRKIFWVSAMALAAINIVWIRSDLEGFARTELLWGVDVVTVLAIIVIYCAYQYRGGPLR